MSKTPNYDAKIKSILDATRPGERVCALTGEKWMMTEEEIGWYKKFQAPPHAWSPLTRMQQLVGFFEMYQFWYRTHPETGKRFIACVHPSTNIPVLPDTEWFGKDFSSIHQEVDTARPFFAQMHDLQLRVPAQATRSLKLPENSIAMASFGDVNSYFVMACASKNSLYSTDSVHMENSAEVSAGTDIQNSFHVLMSHRIFNCKFVQGSYDCLNSSFLFDCRNCEFCFGATNKRGKKYLWMNESCSKEAYEKKMATVDLSSRRGLAEYQAAFAKLIEGEAVWPENFNEQCTNTTGEYTRNAVDCQRLFAGIDGPFRHLSHVTYAAGNTYDSAFSAGIYKTHDAYLCNAVTSCASVRFCLDCVRSQGLEYCMFCFDCENCFGCISLQKKKFHIFNKPYLEEEYWQRVDELKCAMLERGEYGNFFPAKLFYSYWPDNGLILYLAQNQADQFVPNHFDPEGDGAIGSLDTSSSIPSSEVPDSIDEVQDEKWVGRAMYDADFQRNFAFLKPELDFYRKHRLPAPTSHFIKRVYDLFLEQNSALFVQAACTACGKQVEYAKNYTYPRKRILCRPCYLAYLEKNG